ncbi:LPXTG cell wall anchor domain-containing protein [Streptomyces sp. NPDC051561]|uniref:LPXTG cell wall anchor domain-containing protein n=1 Tax=Streptomyces sp. NPDC051561 TaxID=3365658 RepID=UPI00378FCC18
MRSPSPLRSRSRLSLGSRTSGAAMACGVVLAAVAGAPAAYAAEGDAPAGKRSVQVVMVNFQDSTLTGTAKLKSTLEGTYYGASGSLTSYYNEITRNKATFGPRDAGQKVLGPLTLPMSGAGCDTSKMADETYKALAARGIAKDSFDHVSIVFPNSTAKCEFAGLGTVGGGKTWMPAEEFSANALIHEFGHNLGYHHHMRLRCPEGDLGAGCKEDGTSHKSVMGGGGSAAGLSAPELIHNKWLGGAELAQVTKSGTYTLRPLAGSGSGVRALSIPLGGGGEGGGDRLIVDFRAEAGALDGKIQGVHAYRVTEGDYAESAFIDPTPGDGESPDADALKPGSELTDTARKVRVKVISAGTGSAKVSVSLNGVPAPAGGSNPAPQTQQTSPAGGTENSGTEQGGTDDKGGTPSGGTATPESPAGSPAAAPATSPNSDLAATGGSSTTLPLALGGATFLALGAAALLKIRRRRG